ncbi:MAG: amidophosphoribosyltransferase [Chitinophagales bacterium]|jgi:amidophosphoribosyltransferase|nr:amidophosphoribosyltransferase [Chitinophagales bacterium]
MENFWDKMQEECGVFGVYAPNRIDTFSLMEFGLFALQHRGQEACGLSVLKEGKINTFKKSGLVLDSFKSIENIEDFQGNAAIGHTRYSTAGGNSRINIQPLYAQDYLGQTILSVAHNGNLVNYESLRKELDQKGVNFLASSDTEVILRMIQYFMRSTDVQTAIQKTLSQIQGAYSLLVLTQDKLFAIRDPFGIRPLCYGMLEDGTYVFSSESSGLDAVGATYVRDLAAGEMVCCDDNGLHSMQYTQNAQKKVCSFEYIYFARPDSIIDQLSVYQTRVASGVKLFQQNPIEADLVIGVPDSGVPAAVGYSQASGIPFIPALVKNRYISRSFIIPTQEMRDRVINLKLNPIVSQIYNKRVVVIDDSIVRGTTSKRLINILKEAGAKEIHFRSASPPIIEPCFLGIDTPDKSKLIASSLSIPELENYLGVTSLDFLSMENLIEILGSQNHCFGCFTGKYPVSPSPLKAEKHDLV